MPMMMQNSMHFGCKAAMTKHGLSCISTFSFYANFLHTHLRASIDHEFMTFSSVWKRAARTLYPRLERVSIIDLIQTVHWAPVPCSGYMTFSRRVVYDTGPVSDAQGQEAALPGGHRHAYCDGCLIGSHGWGIQLSWWVSGSGVSCRIVSHRMHS